MRGRHRAAVTAFFAVNGAAFASLFSRMPDLQRQHGLGDGTLGLVLLIGALALVIAQPLPGAWAARIGSLPAALAVVGLLCLAAAALAPAARATST